MMIQPITPDDWFTVWNGYRYFREHSNSPRNQNTRRRYEKFLGIKESTLDAPNLGLTEELTPAARLKIRWLLSPHGKAILKAWYLRNEYDSVLVHKAAKKWCDEIHKTDIYHTVHLYSFAIFIGYPHEVGKSAKIVDTANPKVRRIINLINGPNGTAILKIMEIRKCS
jgi:hypothetical protein